MPRLIYTLIFYLALPLVGLRLLWRSRRQPEYRRHIAERFGFYPRSANTQPLIWIHAVSVGETRAAFPLIEALLDRFAGHRIVLTHMTPTGRQTGLEIAARHPGCIDQVYLPYDLPGACRRFFNHWQPCIGLLMETEIWPNLLARSAREHVPVMLVNARLSERSARGYGKIAALARPAFASLVFCAAQSQADADRLQKAGVRCADVYGNLKFDFTPEPAKQALGQQWKNEIDSAGTRRIWLAASTREGEEALILDALAAKPLAGRALCVLVPRHPQRFDDVAALIEKKGFRCLRRSRGLPDADTEVWLGDSMGEMAAYYTLADVALIGGSLLPFGGQNLIEAAACGCPVLIGPHTFNFAQATADAIAGGAAHQLPDVNALPAALDRLLTNEAELGAMSRAAHRFATAHRGATERTVAAIERILAEEKSRPDTPEQS